MGQEQVGAEATRLVDQALDLRDGVVGRADDGEAGVDHRLDLVDVVTLRRQRQGADSPEVVEPVGQPERHVLPGLLAGEGEVHGPDQPPPPSVDRPAELGGSLLHHVPVQAEHVEAAAIRRPERQQAGAEPAGQPGPGR